MMLKPAVVSGVVILALAGYLGYHTIHQPAQEQLRQLQEQVNLERDTQVLKESIIRDVEEIAQLRKRLPPKPEAEWLLREVGTIAQTEGVQLASVAPEDPKRVQDGVRLAVTLRFLTSYHQLGRFLSALENSPHFLWIETMEVSRDPSMGLAQVTLAVSSMWVPPMTISP